MQYAKVFDTLWSGTLRGKPDEILVFVNLLTHAGYAGEADIHFKQISDETGLPEQRVRDAISHLAEPDLNSRSADDCGRRIKLMDDHRDWGWVIVNREKYRMLCSPSSAQKRENTRLRVAAYRARRAKSAPEPVTCNALPVTDVTCNALHVTNGLTLNQNPQNTNGLENQSKLNVTCNALPVVVLSTSTDQRSGEEGGTGGGNPKPVTVTPGLFQKIVDRVWQAYDKSPNLSPTGDQVEFIRQIMSRPDVEREIDLVIQFKKDAECFPESVTSLLMRWDETVDRAKNPNSKTKSGRLRNVPATVQLRSLDQAIEKHPANSQSAYFQPNCSKSQRSNLKLLIARRQEIQNQIANATL